MKQKILVVDDEAAICDLIKLSLQADGYEIACAYDGRDALAKFHSFAPDLVILDLMLPLLSGYEVCKQIVSQKPVPILMLTAKTDLVDKVLGLELGADDYMTKPFHIRELTARVKALLRRAASVNTEEPVKLENGAVYLIPSRRQVKVHQQEVDLSAKEFELLYFLMRHPEQVFSRDALLQNVWGYDYAGDTRTVDVHIQRLRKKLGEEKQENPMIQTVFGVGYKLRRHAG